MAAVRWERRLKRRWAAWLVVAVVSVVSVLALSLLGAGVAAAATSGRGRRPVLEAQHDPGTLGLFGAVALVLLTGLVVAHLRLLRAVSRAAPSTAPARGSSRDLGH
jgi:TRAP-type C4-dicarboxylate transport system permease small subunit